MYGKRHTKETIEKMRKVKIGENNPMYGVKGWHHTLETKEKLKRLMSGKGNPGYGIHLPSPMKGKHYLPGSHCSEKQKRTVSEVMRKLWQNSEYKDRVIKSFIKARATKPNKLELELNTILQKILPNEYALNVKAEIMILGGKIPDFVNVNGQKKVIEAFGEYWHTKRADSYTDTEKGRIDHFRKYGWDTLIVWENELKNLEQVKQKILEFDGR